MSKPHIPGVTRNFLLTYLIIPGFVQKLTPMKVTTVTLVGQSGLFSAESDLLFHDSDQLHLPILPTRSHQMQDPETPEYILQIYITLFITTLNTLI